MTPKPSVMAEAGPAMDLAAAEARPVSPAYILPDGQENTLAASDNLPARDKLKLFR